MQNVRLTEETAVDLRSGNKKTGTVPDAQKHSNRRDHMTKRPTSRTQTRQREPLTVVKLTEGL